MGGKDGEGRRRGDILRLNLKQVRNVIIAVALLVLAGEVGYWIGNNRVQVQGLRIKVQSLKNAEIPSDKQDVDFSLFWEVWDRLEKTYLEKGNVDPEKMVYGAITGMTAALGDPYTVFFASG